MLTTGVWMVPVASVIGSVGSNTSSPLDHAYVKITAFDASGAGKYARGVRSCAAPTAGARHSRTPIKTREARTVITAWVDSASAGPAHLRATSPHGSSDRCRS